MCDRPSVRPRSFYQWTFNKSTSLFLPDVDCPASAVCALSYLASAVLVSQHPFIAGKKLAKPRLSLYRVRTMIAGKDPLYTGTV